MKAKLRLGNPDELEATLTVTMRVSEWKQLREQIADKHPGWKFSGYIAEMIRKAEETIWHTEEQDTSR